MSDELAHLFELSSTAVTITSRSAYYPDAGLPSEATVDVYARVAHQRIVVLGPSGRVEVDLKQSDWERIITLADAAISLGSGGFGPDTAIGRTMTHLDVQVDRYHEDNPTRSELYYFNHAGSEPGEGPRAWGALVDALVETLDNTLAEHERQHMTFVRRWFAD